MNGQKFNAIALITLASVCAAGADQLSKTAQQGMDLVNQKVWRKGASYLKEASKEDPQNATIAEYLGLASLYAADGLDEKTLMAQAEASMNSAVELGGRATVIVDRSKEGFGVENIVDVERGRLHFYKDRIEYKAERTPTQLIFPKEDFKEIAFNRGKGANTHAFHIQTRKNKDQKRPEVKADFRPASFKVDEGRILMGLVKKYWEN